MQRDLSERTSKCSEMKIKRANVPLFYFSKERRQQLFLQKWFGENTLLFTKIPFQSPFVRSKLFWENCEELADVAIFFSVATNICNLAAHKSALTAETTKSKKTGREILDSRCS